MYNGYKNYETWCVSLWLDNDEGNYNAVRELGQEHLSDALEDERDRDDARYTLAGALKDYVEDLPEASAVLETASFVSDLLGAALSEVDWDEIAGNILSDLPTPA